MRTSTIAASRLVAILASRLCDIAFLWCVTPCPHHWFADISRLAASTNVSFENSGLLHHIVVGGS